MGLDMYIIGGDDKEIAYWRKHPDLHGYIVKTFADGEDDCQPIPLDAEKIGYIMEAVESNTLPKTTGFFFGDSSWHNAPETLDQLQEVLDYISRTGKSVYYQASW